MTDRTAFNLGAIKARQHDISANSYQLRDDKNKLIAAVEALREDVAGYKSLFDMAQKRERPWIEAWRKATGKHGTLPDYGKLLAWICDRAEAGQAREAELAGALGGLLDSVEAHNEANDRIMVDPHAITAAEDALAATPTEALERANLGKELIKVSDAVIDSGRRLRSDPGTHQLMLASLCCVMGNLAKLDALAKLDETEGDGT